MRALAGDDDVDPSAQETAVGCPACGAPAVPGQLACLACGAHSPTSKSTRTGARAAAVAALAAAAVALIVAVALHGGDGGDGRDATNDRQDVAVTVIEPPQRAQQPAAATTPDDSAQDEPEPSAEGLQERDGLHLWPARLRGFTVVLLTTGDPDGARSFAREAATTGGEVGVIHSDDFDSLPEGLYMVFAGHYPTRTAANAGAVKLAERFPGAYAQPVQP